MRSAEMIYNEQEASFTKVDIRMGAEQHLNFSLLPHLESRSVNRFASQCSHALLWLTTFLSTRIFCGFSACGSLSHGSIPAPTHKVPKGSPHAQAHSASHTMPISTN